MVLVLLFWWVPIGLHRIWMQRGYWWLHAVAAMTLGWLALHVLYSRHNIELMHQLIMTKGAPVSPLDIPGGWLVVSVAMLWLMFLAYDAVMLFHWPVPDKSWKCLHHEK